MIEVGWKTRIVVERRSVPAATPKFFGWRWLHGAEGGRMPPADMPEIVPPVYVLGLEMTEPIQWLSYKLMVALNPLITPILWHKLHSFDRAMTNKPQNGYDGGTPHRDYINRTELTATNPTYDKMQRGFGGSYFEGDELADAIRCVPGTHGIDARSVTMSNVDAKVQEAIENHWYVRAVNINSDGTVISDFAQGKGGIVAYPFIFDRPIYHYKSYQGRQYLEAWNSDTLPDPLKIYH